MEALLGTEVNPYGIAFNPPAQSMDPLTLDAYLLKHRDMDAYCNLRWTGRAWNYMKFKNTQIRFKATYSGKTVTHPSHYKDIPDLKSDSLGLSYLSTIESQLRAGRPVIAMIGGKGDGKVDHFVVITGELPGNPGNFIVNDPAQPAKNTHLFPDPKGSKFGPRTPWPYQLWGIVTMHYKGPTNS
jgi:hypothetical protein